jgi:hypothetical protein
VTTDVVTKTWDIPVAWNGRRYSSSANVPEEPTTPVNIGAPVVTGTATVGQTLSCSTGTWSASPTGYAYQWLRGGAEIGSATANTYELVLDDLGELISCEVTASNGEGSGTPAESNEAGPIAPESGGLVQGDLHVVTGSGFGTRPDYNFGDYTFMGERHIHAVWGYFDQAMPADGSSQATFRAALDGLVPATGFNFNGNPSSSLHLTLQTGGPSQSGRYLRKVSTAFAQGGYLMYVTGSGSEYPDNPYAYSCFKFRGSGQGKIFRWWENSGAAENWYMGGQALVSENNGTPTYWYQNWSPDDENFERAQIFLREANASQLKINGTTILLTSNNFTVANLVQVSQNDSRDISITWPNSVDTGGVFEYADLYYDFTEARAEIQVGSVVEIQPVNSWADGSITIIFNKGELSAGTGTLRIYDASSNVLHSESVEIA